MVRHKFLHILDPLEGLQVKTDTSLALMAEAASRGVENFVCTLDGIYLSGDKAGFLCAPVEIQNGYRSAPKYLSSLTPRSVDDFRVVFMRKDPPVDHKFAAALMMLRCHDRKKTLVLNDPDALLVANEKLFGLKFAENFFPKTLVSSQPELLKSFLFEHKKVVIKPLFQAGGAGVLVFEDGDLNFRSAIELLTNSFTQPIIIQAYIKNAKAGDKRILLLDGKPLGAILRVPSSHDHRANLHVGGTPKACDLSPRDQEVIAAIGPHLRTHGMHFVGIDVIDGFLTEINVTSPTCLLEMEAQGLNEKGQTLRAEVLDYIFNLIA